MFVSVGCWNRWLRRFIAVKGLTRGARTTSRRTSRRDPGLSFAAGIAEVGSWHPGRRYTRRRSPLASRSIENLDIRTLLSASLNDATGLLSIQGTSSDDVAIVEFADNATVRVVLNAEESLWPVSGIQSISFTGGDGADRFENRTSIPAQANGGMGPDSLIGGSGPATLMGSGGDDVLTGSQFDDSLSGGTGADTITGQGGNDWIDGRQGDDDLSGGDGRDIVIGGTGNDRVDGGAGEDIVQGGRTEYDADLTAQSVIHAEWTSTASSYDARVSALIGSAFLYSLDVWQFGVGGNVFDDLQTDIVSGGSETDLILAPADPDVGDGDIFTDIETGERVTAPQYSQQPPAPGPAIPRPGYLETITDPTFGTQITRISGDPGTLVSSALSADDVWGPAIRNHYVTDSAWNVDGTLISLRSVGPLSYRLVLGGDSSRPDEYLQPLAIRPGDSTQYRWSQNPARATTQFAFPAEFATTAPATPGPEDHLIYEINALTGERVRTIELPFNKFATSKLTLAHVNGQELVALMGRDRGQPNGPVTLYIVNLDATPGQPPVVASMNLEAGVTIGEPNPRTMRFSPDGRHVLLAYPRPAGGRSWRLVERGPDGALRPHAQPSLPEQSYFMPGDRADGFMAVNWGHPVFAYDSQFNSHIVGSPYNFDDISVPGVATFNNNTSRVGSLLAYNINTRSYRSLTDSTPTMPSTAVAHVTATNHANPGNVFAVFGRSPASGGPSGQLVSISLDNPEGLNGSVGLVHHRSSFNRVYFAQPHPVLSPDGTQLIFSSTWGGHQGHISTFLANLAPHGAPQLDAAQFTIDMNQIQPESLSQFDRMMTTDFNLDGLDDLFFLSNVTGQNMTAMNNGDGSYDMTHNWINPRTVNERFDFVFAGDFNGDGRNDIFFYRLDGFNRISYSTGTGFNTETNQINPRGINEGYDQFTPGDFNGDGRDDLLLFHAPSGFNRIAYSQGNGTFSIVTNEIPQRGVNEGYDQIQRGDYNGDGLDDLYLFRSRDGFNRIAYKRPGGVTDIVTNQLAMAGVNDHFDRVVKGDFNSNGRDDLFFLRTSDGFNRIAYSSISVNNFHISTNEIRQEPLMNRFDYIQVGHFARSTTDDLFFFSSSTGTNATVTHVTL